MRVASNNPNPPAFSCKQLQATKSTATAHGIQLGCRVPVSLVVSFSKALDCGGWIKRIKRRSSAGCFSFWMLCWFFAEWFDQFWLFQWSGNWSVDWLMDGWIGWWIDFQTQLRLMAFEAPSMTHKSILYHGNLELNFQDVHTDSQRSENLQRTIRQPKLLTAQMYTKKTTHRSP